MRDFILNDKDFESMKAPVANTDIVIELRKMPNKEYAVLEHIGGQVCENGTYTKRELEVLWKMLTK